MKSSSKKFKMFSSKHIWYDFRIGRKLSFRCLKHCNRCYIITRTWQYTSTRILLYQYPALKLEFIPIHHTVLAFKYYLFNNKSVILSDRKPLKEIKKKLTTQLALANTMFNETFRIFINFWTHTRYYKSFSRLFIPL